MLQRIGFLGAIAAAALVAATVALAGGNDRSAREGARCVKAGVSFLLKNDLLVAAADGTIDYDTIDSDIAPFTSGLVNANLPAGSFLSLGTVVKLHLTSPELFDWCGKKKGDDDDDD